MVDDAAWIGGKWGSDGGSLCCGMVVVRLDAARLADDFVVEQVSQQIQGDGWFLKTLISVKICEAGSKDKRNPHLAFRRRAALLKRKLVRLRNEALHERGRRPISRTNARSASR